MPKTFTPLAKQTAMLSAMGKGPREVARLLGCHENTVIAWQRDERWQAERAKWVEAGLAKLDEAITSQRAEMLQLHDEFIAGVRDSINAVTPDGFPNWPVRLAGLKLIHDHPAIKAMLGPALQQEGGGGGGGSQVMVVEFHVPADQLPRQVGDAVVVEGHEVLELEAADETGG